LRILSFIGIGFSFLMSLSKFGLIDFSSTSLQIFQQNSNIYCDVIDVIGAFVCLAGVIYMWKLMRIGYYIYIAGEIIPPIISVILYGQPDIGSSPITSLNMIMLLVGLIIPIVFVIMYRINLKYMS